MKQKTKTRTAILYASIASLSGLIVTALLEILHRAIYHESHYLLAAALFGVASLIGFAFLAYKATKEG